MVTRTVLFLIILATIVSIGCAGGKPGKTVEPISSNSGGTTESRAGPVSPTWIDAEVEGPAISIPAIEVDSGKMLHFRVTIQETSQAYMVYKLGGETYVRANICPPCRSVGFSLLGNTLVCNTCGTKFEASTGKGISGACKDYPKAQVAYVISGGRITMGMDDLLTAYENTQRPGLP